MLPITSPSRHSSSPALALPLAHSPTALCLFPLILHLSSHLASFSPSLPPSLPTGNGQGSSQIRSPQGFSTQLGTDEGFFRDRPAGERHRASQRSPVEPDCAPKPRNLAKVPRSPDAQMPFPPPPFPPPKEQ